MPKCRSPASRQSSLDELADLLATGSRDVDRLEAGCELLKRRLRTSLGIPYYETENPAQAGITSFLEEVAKDPTNRAIVTGAYLWTLTKHRHYDNLRKLQAEPATESMDSVEAHIEDRLVRDSCSEAFADQQRALSLQLHAAAVLNRHADRHKDLLGGRLKRCLQVVHLVASSSQSADSTFQAAAAVLCEEGVLGGTHTRSLRARLDRQPELRRELSMPARLVKSAKPGSSTDE